MTLLCDPQWLSAARDAPSKVKDTDERYTPEYIWRAAGPIALDPCCPPHNPTGARIHLSLPQNGLLVPWPVVTGYGCVWVNPPYSTGQIMLWAQKIVHEFQRRVWPIYVLTSGDFTTRWFPVLWDAFSCCILLEDRVAYLYPGETKPRPGSNFGNIVWGFTHDNEQFFNKFGHLGRQIENGKAYSNFS